MKKGHAHNLEHYAYVSPMRQWNSVWKTIFSVAVIFNVLAVNSIRLSLATICFMGITSIGIGKIHTKDYFRFLTIPFTFILLSGLAIALQIGGDMKDSVVLPGNITLGFYIKSTACMLTRHGSRQALRLMANAFACVSSMYLLTLSTPMGDLLYVLRKFHVPALIIELMHLIYRYIYIMSDADRKQKDAAISRMGYHNYSASLRSFSYGLANLFIISIKRAGTCYDAMESRGYDGELNMLTKVYPVKKKQIVMMILYGVGAGVVLGIG